MVNVYNTHLHANYHHVIPKDIYLGHRVCQAYELIQFIESTSAADTTHLTILLGDLNLTTDDLGFQLIRGILQLHDCFLDRIDKVKIKSIKKFEEFLFYFRINSIQQLVIMDLPVIYLTTHTLLLTHIILEANELIIYFIEHEMVRKSLKSCNHKFTLHFR